MFHHIFRIQLQFPGYTPCYWTKPNGLGRPSAQSYASLLGPGQRRFVSRLVNTDVTRWLVADRHEASKLPADGRATHSR